MESSKAKRLKNVLNHTCDCALNAKPLDIPVVGGEQEMMERAGRWLGKLELFYGMPFEYLVPHPQALPPESLRFFYIDPNYQAALTAGALSVGVSSSLHWLLDYLLHDRIKAVIRQSINSLRTELRQKKSEPSHVRGGDFFFGMLMRSLAVSGWPGLEVAAYYEELPQDPAQWETAPRLQILRMERLAPDILLVLFGGDAVPKYVEIAEPQEGFCFGARPPISSVPARQQYTVALRHLKGDQQGQQIRQDNNPVYADVPFRSNGEITGVIDVAGLVRNVGEKLVAHQALGSPDELQSAELAVQMVHPAQVQGFKDLKTNASRPRPLTIATGDKK